MKQTKRQTHLGCDLRGAGPVLVPRRVWLVEVEGHEVLALFLEPADGRLHPLREGHALVVRLEDRGPFTAYPGLTAGPEVHGCGTGTDRQTDRQAGLQILMVLS